MFSELCECGAISSQIKTKSTISDTGLRTTVKSPTSTTEHDKFYQPPEGFRREEKQKYNEHIFPTVESLGLMAAEASHDNHGISESLNVQLDKSNSTEMLFLLTDKYHPENNLTLSDTDKNVLEEMCGHSTSQQPDLLQDCDKSPVHLFSTSCDDSIQPDFLAENKQEITTLLQDCDKILTNLFPTRCDVSVLPDSTAENKQTANTPDTGFFDDCEGEIDLQFTQGTGCFDNLIKDAYDKHINVSRNMIETLPFEDSWSSDIAVMEKNRDFCQHLEAQVNHMCLDNNGNDISCNTCGCFSNSLFNDSLIHSPEGCDPGSLVDVPQDIHAGSFVDSPENYDPGTVVDAPEDNGPGCLVDTTEDIDPGSLVDASSGCEPDSLVDAPDGCESDSLVNTLDFCESDSLVDSPDDCDPCSLVDALGGYEPDSLVDAPDGCGPGFFVEAPDGFDSDCSVDALDLGNTGSLLHAPVISDSDGLLDASEVCDLDFLSEAPESSGLGYLFDIPEECDPATLIAAPKEGDPDNLVDALQSCGLDSLFDIPEGLDIKNVETQNVNQVAFEENTDCFEDLVPASNYQASVNVTARDVDQATLEIQDFAGDRVGDVSRYLIANIIDQGTLGQITVDEQSGASGVFVDESADFDTKIVDLHNIQQVSSGNDNVLESSVDPSEKDPHENAIQENEKESVFKRYFNFAKDLLGASGKYSSRISDVEQHIINECQIVSGNLHGISTEEESVSPETRMHAIVERKRDVSYGFMDVSCDKSTENANPECEFQIAVDGDRNINDSLNASRGNETDGSDPETEFSCEVSKDLADSMDASRDGVTVNSDSKTEFQITVEGNQPDSMDASKDDVTETIDPDGAALEDANNYFDNKYKNMYSKFNELSSHFTDWSEASSGSSNMALSDLQAANSYHSESFANSKSDGGFNGFHQAHNDEHTWDETGKNWKDFASKNHLSGTDLNTVRFQDFGITEDNKPTSYPSGGNNNDDGSDTDSGTSV